MSERPRYAKKYQPISIGFWRDPGVRSWSEDARWLSLYLLTTPSRITEGLFNLARPLALHELQWKGGRFDAAIRELEDAGFVSYAPEAGVVLITKALKYAPPIGPKSIKGAVRAVDEVQGAGELFWQFLALADQYCPPFASAIRQHYGLPCDGASLDTDSYSTPTPTPTPTSAPTPEVGDDDPFADDE